MANGVTSQWEDLQIKAGNFEERPKETTLSETYLQALECLGHQEKKQVDSDDEDDQFFEQYKQQRLKEMQIKASKYKYGEVYEISREEYTEQVNNASQNNFVVLHLYQDYVIESVQVNQQLIQLAKEYGDIKFVKMVATKCVEKFPDSQVPCLIIYRHGKLQSNLPMVHKMLKKITVAALEYLLREQGVIPKKEAQTEQEEEIQAIIQPQKPKTEADDPIQDREYSHKVYMKY